MERRDFIKKAGLGSAALASLPVVAQGLTTPAWAGEAKGDTRFRAVAISKLTTGTELANINLQGRFGDWGIRAVGSFAAWTPEGKAPFPIVATGYFHATKLISFKPIGTFGVLEAGTLMMEVKGRYVEPDPGSFTAKVTVICNIPAGNLLTGHHEGVTVEGKDFKFEPLDQEVGITIFVPVV